MGKSSHVIALIKFVETIDHANDFLNGNLFCKPWSFFKKVEDQQRGDRLELAAAKLRSKIYSRKANVLYDVWFENTDNAFSPVFCMYSVFSRNCSLHKKIQLHDEDLRGFGKFGVVIKDVKEFIKRLATRIPGFSYGLIDYIDYDNLTDGNQFALKSPITQKDHKLFSYQQEFRIYNLHYAITNDSEQYSLIKNVIPPNEHEAAIFEIGDLSQIAEIQSMDNLLSGMQIEICGSASKKELSKEFWWNGKEYQEI